VYVLALVTQIDGIGADAFNSNDRMINAFKDTVAALLDGVETDDVYDVKAVARTRRHLLETKVSNVHYKVRSKTRTSANRKLPLSLFVLGLHLCV